MSNDKYLNKLLEQHYLKHIKKYYLTIKDINIQLANIHRQIMHHITLEHYRYVTEYIHQYISYTTVWNLKFTMNLENPEVALLQIFHLRYIFERESNSLFKEQRSSLAKLEQIFFSYESYTAEHIEKRRQTMYCYIKKKESN